jgi:hypothetical protein
VISLKTINVALMVIGLVEEDGNLNMVSSVYIIWTSITYGHENTAYTYIWAQSFAYPRAFPEDAHESSTVSLVPRQRRQSHFVPVLISIHDARCKVVNVCARAYEEEEDE